MPRFLRYKRWCFATLCLSALLSNSTGCRQKKPAKTASPQHEQVTSFEFQQVGPDFTFRPIISNVQVVDLDGDERNEILACDVQQNGVFAYTWDGSAWQEKQLAVGIAAPAHATVVDIDGDNDNDLVVSVMGNLHPDDGVIGSLILLENNSGNFEKRTILDDVRRVVDAQPGDFDGDGDIDLAVAVFGYLRGQVLWLENLGNGTFRDHELLVAPGTIHVPVADYDNDGDPDIAAVVSQEEEEVWIFENLGNGEFAEKLVFFTINFDIGSAGLVQTDLDRDGDPDLLLPVGDNLEDKYSYPQPYHGCIWLENLGGLEFSPRRIAHFPGTYAAAVDDIDGDSDTDVVLVSMINDWDSPKSASVCWLENDGKQSFTQHAVARRPIQLTTVDLGDINHDGRVDIIAGGLHVFRPYDRMGRISSWLNQPAAYTADSDALYSEKSNITKLESDIPLPNFRVLDPLTAESFRFMTDHIAKQVAEKTVDHLDWNRLGEALLAYGFFAEASECLRRSININSGLFESHFLLANCESRLGKLASALTHYSDARKCAKDDVDRGWCDFQIAKTHLRLENAAEAESSLRNAGNHPLALYELAKLLARSNRHSDALAVLDKLGAHDSFAIEYLLLKARVLEATGKFEKATHMRDAAEYNSTRLPEEPFALRIERVRDSIGLRRKVKEARAYLKGNQIEQAVKTLHKVNLVSWDQPALFLAAMAELKRANPSDAIRILEKLVDEVGLSPQAMLLLGDAYMTNGNLNKARESWEATAGMRSGIALHERLGRLHDEDNRHDEHSQQKALRFQAMGIADLRNSKVPLATKAFQQALQVDQSLSISWFYLGECYRLSGQLSLAKEAYQRCLNLAPNHGRARERLRKMQ